MAKRRSAKAKDPTRASQSSKAGASEPQVCEVCGKAPGRDQSLMQLQLADGRKSKTVYLRCFKAATEAVKGRQSKSKTSALTLGSPKPKEVPEFCPAEVIKEAERIRAANHNELEDAEIAYVFIPKGPKTGGRVRLGKAHKESATHQLLSEMDFVIYLSKDMWDTLGPEQRMALLDHELCHCAPKLDAKTGERVGWRTKAHDVEEFAEIIERHGLWKPDLRRFAETSVRQLPLIGAEEIR